MCSHLMTILLSAGQREGKCLGNKHIIFLPYMISGEVNQNSDFTLDTLYKQVNKTCKYKFTLSNTEAYLLFYEQQMSHKIMNT